MTILKLKISTRLPAARVAEFLREFSRTFPNVGSHDALPVFIAYDSEAPTLDEYCRLGRTLLATAPFAQDRLDRLRSAGVPEGMIYAIRLASICDTDGS